MERWCAGYVCGVRHVPGAVAAAALVAVVSLLSPHIRLHGFARSMHCCVGLGWEIRLAEHDLPRTMPADSLQRVARCNASCEFASVSGVRTATDYQG